MCGKTRVFGGCGIEGKAVFIGVWRGSGVGGDDCGVRSRKVEMLGAEG